MTDTSTRPRTTAEFRASLRAGQNFRLEGERGIYWLFESRIGGLFRLAGGEHSGMVAAILDRGLILMKPEGDPAGGPDFSEIRVYSLAEIQFV